MATRVIRHEHEHMAGDGTGTVVGIILMIVFLLFLWYAIASGAFQGLIPTGGTNIQIPDKVDVNINQGQ